MRAHLKKAVTRNSANSQQIAEKRVRDFAQLSQDGVISKELADHALNKMEIDDHGLDAIDKRMLLTVIINQYGGGPVGVETLAATIGEETDTIEDVYEPYLMQIGFINRTPRGRVVTFRVRTFSVYPGDR